MITDLFHWLLATFVIAPFQAELDQKLQAANASRAVVAQVQTCMAEATPKLVSRASGDWFWGITTAISVTAGMTRPEQLLADEVPACRPALDAIRPLLQAERA
jgi:hypothetical protein